MMQNYFSSSSILIVFVVLAKYSAGFNTVETQIPTPSITQAPVLTPFPTGNVTSKDACHWMYFALSSCNSISPGFSTASYADQRACLCQGSITTSTFTGAVFDSDVSICADYAHTAAPSYYAELTSLEGFCASTFPMSSYSWTAAASSTLPPETIFPTSIISRPAISSSESPPTNTPIPTSTPSLSGTSSNESPPTNTPSSSPTGGTIQSFNSADIAGVSVGCGAAALLVGFGLYVGVRKKREFIDSDVNQEEILSQEVLITKTG